MKPYVVIDTNTNKVLFVHDWNGIPYDPETNPTGWTPPENTISIDLTGKTREELAEIEAGGTYIDGKFTRPNYIEQPVVDSLPIQDIQQLVQILEDKGIL